jgi:hypothetical protein
MKVVIVGGRRLIDLDELLKDIGVIPEGEISEYDAGRWDEQLEFDKTLQEDNKALNNRNQELKQKLDEMSALADERYDEIIYLRERIAELERGEDDGK